MFVGTAAAVVLAVSVLRIEARAAWRRARI
jgi:hypothetical protein